MKLKWKQKIQIGDTAILYRLKGPSWGKVKSIIDNSHVDLEFLTGEIVKVQVTFNKLLGVWIAKES